MEKYKDMQIKKETRFIICIDDNFDKTYLKDLKRELSNVECYQILQDNFNEIVKMTKSMERKCNKKNVKKFKIIK